MNAVKDLINAFPILLTALKRLAHTIVLVLTLTTWETEKKSASLLGKDIFFVNEIFDNFNTKKAQKFFQLI